MSTRRKTCLPALKKGGRTDTKSYKLRGVKGTSIQNQELMSFLVIRGDIHRFPTKIDRRKVGGSNKKDDESRKIIVLVLL